MVAYSGERMWVVIVRDFWSHSISRIYQNAKNRSTEESCTMIEMNYSNLPLSFASLALSSANAA